MMTDPSNALKSFQEEFELGNLLLHRGVLDERLYLHYGLLNGTPRFTYVRFQGAIVTALVMFALVEPIEGAKCFAIGYAVPEAYRNQGRAREAVSAAISELQFGLSQHGSSAFFIEAIVGTDNRPSQHVAKHTIAANPSAVTDEVSGLPAIRYLRKVE
jgi:hypothetical protein